MEDQFYGSESNFLPLYRPEQPFIHIANLIAYSLLILFSLASVFVSFALPTWPPLSTHWTIIIISFINLSFGILAAVLAYWYREGIMLPRVRTVSLVMITLNFIGSMSIIIYCVLQKPIKSLH